MSTLTFLDDHLRFDWSGAPHRRSHTDAFNLSVSPAIRTPGTLKEECHRVAGLVRDAAGSLPIRVFMSGGADSEIVARSFLDCGIPFGAVIFRYKNPALYELQHAIDFCEGYSIPHEIVPFDEEEFLLGEVYDYAAANWITEPWVAFDLKRLDLYQDAFCVFGVGEMLMTYDGQDVLVTEKGCYYEPAAYMRRHGRAGLHQFLFYTPELILTMMTDPLMRKWVELAPVMQFPDNTYWKLYYYKHYWPELKPRTKANGYERFTRLYDDTKLHLELMYGGTNNAVTWRYEDLLRELRP